MAYYKRTASTVPEETVQVARAAFPKGNPYMLMRDELGELYDPREFQKLFSYRGQPAKSPGILALVTIMQYAEGLTDRQAADAVRARIDWKYALGLALTDSGFDYSVLSEFRDRLIRAGAEEQLLEDMLARLEEAGLLEGRATQRTDSTHVLAAVRDLNRLELVGETLRYALNSVAEANGPWLLGHVTPDWFDRYGERMDDYRLPKDKAEREALALVIGQDGQTLLSALFDDRAAPKGLAAVDALRRVWIQHYWVSDGVLTWRRADEMPPAQKVIRSPFDLTARFSIKRSMNWVGYKVHLTETCGDAGPHLITHVHTTLATEPDVKAVDPVQAALAERDRLPNVHLVDQGYTDATNLVTSQEHHSVDLFGPVARDTTWQGRDANAYDSSRFHINWDVRTATCPEGKHSQVWSESHDTFGNPVVHVRFARHDCKVCPARSRCTRAKRSGRSLKLRTQAAHDALQQARARQATTTFWEAYRARAGIEGTISQAVRSFALRRSRYRGLQKTNLNHVFVASALNFTRAVYWLAGRSLAQTRQSHFAALCPVPCT